MNQGGLKNVVTEPTRLENKRERRRGAAGRAAALRRAPSDSDCSGETASLSADSGDRAPRPPPQPPRTTKNRGRRRGSEWEVLEGLKDGQRFEKRPDVFNGYLHKKRKWPLKGWHKRFFVVDGGILVYARSPTDVARGRLHGSVDVGLSVISAKARRRRIDIDADEFIYHLRAKTPDVFRTWLNVLKAHRLYRQHLLTFGARESVPKIHAPLDDLPPTDNSSRTGTSHGSLDSSTISSSDDFPFPSAKLHPPNEVCEDSFCFCQSSFYPSPDISSPESHKETQLYEILKLYKETKPNEEPKLYEDPKIYEDPKLYEVHLNEKLFHNHRSLCSMNCVARFTQEDLKRRKSPDISIGSTDAEKQIHSTDLDINSVRTIETVIEDGCQINKETSPVRYSKWTLGEGKRPLFLDNKVGPTTAYFFFTRNKSRCMSPNSPMKRSRKSTNLVKYRNFIDEPTLKRPLSKCMLLGKYKMKVPKKREVCDTAKSAEQGVACDVVTKESNEVQVTIIDSKSLQDAMTTSDYDGITEKLMVSIFQNAKNTPASEAKFYIKQVIKDLYDVKFHEVHPVKALFRSLLEYWLKNTSVEPVKHAMKRSRSIARQSNRYFTRDKNLSSVYISNVSKQTQFHGLSEMLVQYKKKPKVSQDEKKERPPKCPSPRRDTESFEKERRIQELERLLKNTVYICETSRSKEKDIKITKTLMDNIGKLSRKSEMDNSAEFKNDNSNSSTEKIQDTLNHLISDTALPANVAKELLGAYLDVLLKDDARSLTSTSSESSEHSAEQKASKELSCEVQTEAVVKRVSKSVSTIKLEESKNEKSTEVTKPVDPGQLYLKEILDKITTIFSRVRKLDEKCRNNEKSSGDLKPSNCKKEESKQVLGRCMKEYPGKNLIYENYDENSVVIGLSKYDLEHISMFSDPAIQGIMSITIKLKEKPTLGESNLTRLSLQFADSQAVKKKGKHEYPTKENWIEYIRPKETNSNEIFQKKVKVAENTFIEFPKEFDLKPYTSSSDATSKAYKVIHESEHSLDLSFKSSASLVNDTIIRPIETEGTQSCYIMSFKKDSLATKFQSKKKVRLKDCNGMSLNSRVAPPTKQAELSVFEKPTPRVIDEKFILLLLENLSLLSKNIPSLHKEINSLFMKLRKKHEKILKTCCNIQGLSLLGKIYNEDSGSPHSKDATTQWDMAGSTSGDNNNFNEAAINTANSNMEENLQLNTKDAIVSAIDLKLMMNSQVQTMSNSEELVMKFQRQPPSLGDTSYYTNLARTDSVYSLKMAEMEKQRAKHSTSNCKLYCKKKHALSNALKSMLNTDASEFFIQPLIMKEHTVKKKKRSPKLQRDLIKEITLLSPSFKVSTQSQTDRKLTCFVGEEAIEKEYKLYQLFQSYNVTMASSLTDSNIEVNPSDEMKTLYRCSSDPSCSG